MTDLDLINQSSPTERVNNRDIYRIPSRDAVRKLIVTYGPAAAMVRWGHLWSARGLYAYAGPIPQHRTPV